MIKLLSTAFTEFPNENMGGPNTVIYNILKELNYNKFEAWYFSKHLCCQFNDSPSLHNNLISNLTFRKKIESFLFSNSIVYRKFVMSRLYSKFYLKSANSYYLSKLKNIIFCGRLAKYKYYDMDQVITNSFMVLSKLGKV